MYFYPNFEPVHCSMSSSNCCFLTCIQISQEAGKVVCYSHLLKNFPQFVVIYTVKGFSVANEAEVGICLEFSKDFEHYFASMWDEYNCAVVWTLFGIALLWDWNEHWPFPVLWPLLSILRTFTLRKQQVIWKMYLEEIFLQKELSSISLRKYQRSITIH